MKPKKQVVFGQFLKTPHVLFRFMPNTVRISLFLGLRVVFSTVVTLHVNNILSVNNYNTVKSIRKMLFQFCLAFS